MRVSTGAAVVSVVCGAAVWLYVAPQLVSTGLVEAGELLGLLIVVPTPVGLLASLVGVVAGVVGIARGTDRSWTGALMTVGQIVTWAVVALVVAWSRADDATGWELLALPASLMVGQVLVVAGLIAGRVWRRRGNTLGESVVE
ncbi:hypothetical protein G4X40_16815 [Rhodococcus sp. D2-41]|uniref:Uncharacterized protein n=1 Tax=Speluncibacter jeojiensis TaxID=2710754 RepID=A0A9X4M2L5_9ACTN|nr:hypothetical protein [Rhodococcus sp. D2-41]MDG3011809.1 hypothetical protein [Rhodococcus sp. D2-41]MDG3013261.1 hypothetical protein [Corynebacteriales bacterium D3-21]